MIELFARTTASGWDAWGDEVEGGEHCRNITSERCRICNYYMENYEIREEKQ